MKFFGTLALSLMLLFGAMACAAFFRVQSLESEVRSLQIQGHVQEYRSKQLEAT